ncbi:MAG: cytochrome c oxidase subunit II [Halobacteriales archaeon]|nr:cytochrome c oxidase subunit II [Halobacteriales archaeon]
MLSPTETLVIAPLQAGGLVPEGSRVEVFNQIYWVFLILGTLVGVVVIAYMLWKAYKYRERGTEIADGEDRPQLGELPQGSGGGRKLFTSFALSTIIVVSLVAWTFGTLLYVEKNPPTVTESEDAIEIEVSGFQFGWRFAYTDVPGQSNGVETNGEMRVPVDTPVRLVVTSDDVFHNFGVAELRVKTDAIPGQTTTTWFLADDTGEYEARCFELCGQGHSYMSADVIVTSEAEFEQWYTEQASG